MNRSIVPIIGIALILSSCSPEIKVWTENYSDGKTKEEYQYYNDPETNKRIKNGWYNLYYSSGKYQSVGRYEDDQRDGPWTEYDEQGDVRFDGEYRDGEPWTGTFRISEFSGDETRPFSRVSFVDGVRSGKFWTYFETGKHRSRGEYVDGEVHGDFFWFFEEGGVSEKVGYVEGKEVGEATLYNSDGSVHDISTYRDGVLSGPVVSFSPTGDTLMVGQFENDRKVGVWTRFRKDQPRVRFSTSTFTGQERVSLDTVYTIDGSLLLTGSRTWGKLDGTWIQYSTDGQVIDEDGWREGRCRSNCEGDRMEKLLLTLWGCG